ncbi:hypothetical protein EDEG_02009 [Edhazardia aedis USNM 41457]|uniref:Uncharacterized protein n=1 Tax=Edhazardia aedis (strain USNM 41457) TaxID=1003232 RepID=J9DM41_EDHAE|nr:hypothetical protein EDEG_02009 [Edhazardia aedis USNM 41457]|eukprot:EJW03660.1 hypothetical protein EDEG_02009 [Edhazardia aedis USNM 41457]
MILLTLVQMYFCAFLSDSESSASSDSSQNVRFIQTRKPAPFPQINPIFSRKKVYRTQQQQQTKYKVGKLARNVVTIDLKDLTLLLLKETGGNDFVIEMCLEDNRLSKKVGTRIPSMMALQNHRKSKKIYKSALVTAELLDCLGLMKLLRMKNAPETYKALKTMIDRVFIGRSIHELVCFVSLIKIFSFNKQDLISGYSVPKKIMHIKPTEFYTFFCVPGDFILNNIGSKAVYYNQNQLSNGCDIHDLCGYAVKLHDLNVISLGWAATGIVSFLETMDYFQKSVCFDDVKAHYCLSSQPEFSKAFDIVYQKTKNFIISHALQL